MKKGSYLLILLISVMACRKPYNPPAITSNSSYLVVEGDINAGSDSTTIKLSRTVNISSAITANPVLGATVAVVSDQGMVYPLTAVGNGSYVSAGLNLAVSHQYRLSIKTTNNEQYQSDLVPVSITPPIDSIGFNVVNDPVTGIQIYANTHDASNTVKYFRWDYSEEWEFSSYFPSFYISNGTALVFRTQAQDITVCFTGDASSNIVLGSSAKLQQDVIYQAPIAFIPSTAEKIETEYSILLREHALTAEAYNFWVNLKTNSEDLGSIFDAQPSQINGNIHCITNPSEPVIGYISACTVSSKRVFIANSQLPNWVPTYPYNCPNPLTAGGTPADTVNNGSYNYYNILVYDTAAYLPTGPPPPPPIPPHPPALPTFFEYAPRDCVDCTIRGTTTPPSYWQ
jgi:hypothetical protein